MVKVAVVTQVKNEPLFLPLWRRHYGRNFGYCNLFIIDDGSNDDSTKLLYPSHVICRPSVLFDEVQRANEISRFLRKLLMFYDWVIYTDVDEFLLIDPLLKMDFVTYLTKIGANHINAVGINILHNVYSEGQFDPSRPVFTQRCFGRFDRAYFKQLVHSDSVVFGPGFHLSNRANNFAPGLYLMHLALFDKDNTRNRWLVRNRINWSESALKNNHSVQFRMPVEEYVASKYKFHFSQFEDASTPERFSSCVLDVIRRTTREKSLSDWNENAAYMEKLPFLRLPARFRDVIPASTASSEEEEASRAPSFTWQNSFDPVSLYQLAFDEVHS